MPNVNPDHAAQDPEVNCAECMKKVRSAEAYDPEGLDAEMSFCGLECYEAWTRKAAREQTDSDDAPHPPRDPD